MTSTLSTLSTTPRHRAETDPESATTPVAESGGTSVHVGTFVVRVVAWTVILAAVAVLAVGVVIPRVSGSTPYTVLTGSMTPTYPPGTLVVIRPTPVDEIQVGQAITFQLDSGQSTVVTHRVIGTRLDEFGDREFIVQGDANAAPDADPVRAVQVRGVVWYSVPELGHANTWLTGQERQLGVYAVAALLFAYAGSMFLRGAVEKRRTRHGASA